MALPRITAAIFVILLIGSLALVGVGGVAWLGPYLAHGNNVEHENGTIQSISPDMKFTFMTVRGQKLNFQCRVGCRASLGHLQRHKNEQAETDVYYILGQGGILLAVDVD